MLQHRNALRFSCVMGMSESQAAEHAAARWLLEGRTVGGSPMYNFMKALRTVALASAVMEGQMGSHGTA